MVSPCMFNPSTESMKDTAVRRRAELAGATTETPPASDMQSSTTTGRVSQTSTTAAEKGPRVSGHKHHVSNLAKWKIEHIYKPHRDNGSKQNERTKTTPEEPMKKHHHQKHHVSNLVQWKIEHNHTTTIMLQSKRICVEVDRT